VKSFIEEDETSGTFHIIIAVERARRISDRKEEITVGRVVLREVRCLSWDEEPYEINHCVDEKGRVERMKVLY